MQDLKNRRKPNFTAEADTYSFGILYYEVLTGLVPFKGNPESDYDIALQGMPPSFSRVEFDAFNCKFIHRLPDNMPNWTMELIRRRWERDPFRKTYT